MVFFPGDKGTSGIKWTNYLVFETHITWSTSVRVNSSSLFVRIDDTSAKPNKEWSVNTVFKPIVLACMIASWHMVENA